MARGNESVAEREHPPSPASTERPDHPLDFKARVRLLILGGSSVLLVILWSILLARGVLTAAVWLFHHHA